MTIDPELRQMRHDAARARAGSAAPVRAWHALAERLDFARAAAGERRAARTRAPISGGPLMLFDDLHLAWRRLRGKPGTALTAVAMLTLAIGVSSAMFAVADHMLFSAAPFKDADRLRRVFLGETIRDSRSNASPPLARQFRQVPAFADVQYLMQDSVYLEGLAGLASKGAYWVSPGVFDMLGVRPMLGRTFTNDEGRQGTSDRAVISERAWRGELGADPNVIGRRVTLSGEPYTVIGVMPSTFRFPYESTQIWLPYDIDAPPAERAPRRVDVVVRLDADVPEADAASLAARATAAEVSATDKQGVLLRPLEAGLLDDYSRTAIQTLFGGVLLVFVVLCANAANLMLARVTARRAEFGVCTALGASRRRLLTQAVVEAGLIGVAALVAGTMLAAALVAATRNLMPEYILWRTLNPIALDLRALLATAGLAVVATLVAGVIPSWIATGASATASLRVESRGSTESRGARLWTRTLLVGEVALATALLVGAGVLVTSFVRLMRADPGLDLRGVTMVGVSLPSPYFKDRPARAAVTESIERELRSLPGVTAVSLSFGAPPSGGGFSWGHLVADGQPLPGDAEQIVFQSQVGSDFFDVYGIRLLSGRTFAPGEDVNNVIVSEGLASMLWNGQSPLGHRFRFADGKTDMTVIGVAREVRSALSDPREDLPEYYQPFGGAGGSMMMLGLRCAGACPSETVIRERLRAANPQAVPYRVASMASLYAQQFERPNTAASLAAMFSVVALIAAAGGLFSILTHAVGRRRREFGVRSALGAEPAALRRLVLRDGLATAAVGVAIGAGLSALGSKVLTSIAFGVSAANPAVWTAVIATIVGATLLASWRPAVQAMRADPVELLRDN
jgi:predicted permease